MLVQAAIIAEIKLATVQSKLWRRLSPTFGDSFRKVVYNTTTFHGIRLDTFPVTLFTDAANYIYVSFTLVQLTLRYTLVFSVVNSPVVCMSMSSVRESVEWVFGKIITNFAFLDFKKNLKLLLQPVGKCYMVGMIFTNCHTRLYGSRTSVCFDVQPPQLEDYLGNQFVQTQTTYNGPICLW